MKTIAKFISLPFMLSEILRRVICRYKIGSPRFRYLSGAHVRPAYAFLVYEAALLAHRLGYQEISIIEFGVGGGGGLLELEYHIEWVEKLIPVKMTLLGFDTGIGLPRATDFRDLPYVWQPGSFVLNEGVTSKLRRGKLIIGDVKDTIPVFFKNPPPPIGAIAFDLDYYSSTAAALKVFDGSPKNFLPRLPLYFDDTLGSMLEMHIDDIGERAAIKDFNSARDTIKIGSAYTLRAAFARKRWHQQIYFAHLFSHPKYAQNITNFNNNHS